MLNCGWNVYTNRTIRHVVATKKMKARRNIDSGFIAAKDSKTLPVHGTWVSKGFCTHMHTRTTTNVFNYLLCLRLNVKCIFYTKLHGCFLGKFVILFQLGAHFFVKCINLEPFQLVKIY